MLSCLDFEVIDKNNYPTTTNLNDVACLQESNHLGYETTSAIKDRIIEMIHSYKGLENIFDEFDINTAKKIKD